jgi:hypothetical protein
VAARPTFHEHRRERLAGVRDGVEIVHVGHGERRALDPDGAVGLRTRADLLGGFRGGPLDARCGRPASRIAAIFAAMPSSVDAMAIDIIDAQAASGASASPGAVGSPGAAASARSAATSHHWEMARP